MNQRGQAQILAAAALSATMLALAVFSLQHAGQVNKSQIRGNRRTEMRAALEDVIKRVSYLYHDEASCDPAVLNDKLNRLQADGSLAPQGVPGNRIVQVTVNNFTYPVSVGPIARLAWSGNIPTMPTDPSRIGTGLQTGTSEDVIIEVWTQLPGTNASNQLRVAERAALLNTCTLPCSGPVPAGDTACPVPNDQAIAFHRVTDLSLFPAEFDSSRRNWPSFCAGSAHYGDITGDNLLNRDDMVILRNYLRSGSGTGVSANILACGDLNNDSLVNEVDLGILQKAMRGYLYWMPTHY